MRNDLKTILYYDGSCALCNRCVQFVLHHDKKQQIYFAALQNHFKEESFKTVVFKKGNTIYYKSDAVLQLLIAMGGIWRGVVLLYTLPKFLRNKLYDLVAQRRYKWLGGATSCLIPTKENAARFL
jgi:predicted DCC family thiol-disulfide oxidoreductase YuxK